MNKIQVINKKFQSNFIGWKPLFGLINESFWKGVFGPFFAFIFPLIFIAILGNVLGYDEILGGSLAISPMAITTTSMPMLLFEFKSSSLLKRIGSTPIKPSSFIFVTIIYYLVIILLSILWTILFSLLIFGITYWDRGRVIQESNQLIPEMVSMSFKQTLENVNWLGFLWGQLMLTLTGLVFGMFLVAVCKSIISIQAIGTTVLIISQFLTAMVLPIGILKNIDALWYLGYVISPFKAGTSIILESWNGSVSLNDSLINNDILLNANKVVGSINIGDFTIQGNPFDINQTFEYYDTGGKTVVILDKTEKIVTLILPFLWIILFGILATKFFKWSAR